MIADQVAVNPAKADLTERQRAIVDFALRVAEDSASITDDDLDDMRAKGFSNDEIWDIGAITALFALSNRYANFAGIRPNDEFYAMARDWRQAPNVVRHASDRQRRYGRTGSHQGDAGIGVAR